MKTTLLTLLSLWMAVGLPCNAQSSEDPSSSLHTRDELKELLGPIALYPDPLISLILPASTVPSDIVLAERFVATGGDPAEAEDKPWDPSVKALVRYPDTLKWLEDNLDWTTQLGDAFIDQPVNVMEAIQSLRARAKAMGNLADTPEEKVVEDDNNIRIVPAQPEVIYVPSYDPEVVYERRAEAEPLVYFSEPYEVGPWLGYDFDWHRHHLYRGEWRRGWDYRRDRDRERDGDVFVTNNIRNTRIWQVDSKRRQSEIRRHSKQHSADRGHQAVVHPKEHFVDHTKGGHKRQGDVIGGGKHGVGPIVRTPIDAQPTDKGGKGHTEGRNHADISKTGDKGFKHGDKGGKGHIETPTTPPDIKTVDKAGKGGKGHIETPTAPPDIKTVDKAGKGHSEISKTGDKHGDKGGKGHIETPTAPPDIKTVDKAGKGHSEISKTGDAIKHGDKGGKGHIETPTTPPDIKAVDKAGKGHSEISKTGDAIKHVEKGGKGHPAGATSVPEVKGTTPKSKVEVPKPHVEVHKEAPKPHVEVHKEAPKPHVEVHKEAPKPHVEAHKATPKPHVEAHKEAPKPHVEVHKPAPKPSPAGGSADPKKKKKKDHDEE